MWALYLGVHYSIQMANIVTLTGGRDSGSANGSGIRGRNMCLAPGAGNPRNATDITQIIFSSTSVWDGSSPAVSKSSTSPPLHTSNLTYTIKYSRPCAVLSWIVMLIRESCPLICDTNLFFISFEMCCMISAHEWSERWTGPIFVPFSSCSLVRGAIFLKDSLSLETVYAVLN